MIIATFTYVQAPFRVHADFSAGEPAMRDCERFHFGFTVPLGRPYGSRRASSPRWPRRRATSASSRSRGDRRRRSLVGGARRRYEAPKIIARLPFVEREDHPAGLPVFAISPEAASGRHCQGCGNVEPAGGRLGGARPAQALASLAEAVVIPGTAGSTGPRS